MNEMRSIFLRSIFIGPLLLTCHAGAQEHRFEDDPIVAVRENSSHVTCFPSYSASWENPRFLLRRRMRTAACRRSGPRLREAWAFFSASIRTTGRPPANGRMRKRYRNERERPSVFFYYSARANRVKLRGLSVMPHFARIFLTAFCCSRSKLFQ